MRNYELLSESVRKHLKGVKIKTRRSEGGAEEPVNLWGRRVHRGEQGHGQGLQIKLGQDDEGGSGELVN